MMNFYSCVLSTVTNDPEKYLVSSTTKKCAPPLLLLMPAVKASSSSSASTMAIATTALDISFSSKSHTAKHSLRTTLAQAKSEFL